MKTSSPLSPAPRRRRAWKRRSETPVATTTSRGGWKRSFGSARTVGREFRVETAGEGYAKERQELKEATEANEQKVADERKKAAEPIEAAYQKRLGDIQALIDKQQPDDKGRRMVLNKQTGYLQSQEELDAEAAADRDKQLGPIDARARQQREQFAAINKAKQDRLERQADEHRDLSDVNAVRDSEILRGADEQAAEIKARRAQDAIKAREYDRTMRPDEAASARTRTSRPRTWRNSTRNS